MHPSCDLQQLPINEDMEQEQCTLTVTCDNDLSVRMVNNNNAPNCDLQQWPISEDRDQK